MRPGCRDAARGPGVPLTETWDDAPGPRGVHRHVTDLDALHGRGLAAHPTDAVVVLAAVREDGAVVDFVHELANEPALQAAGRPLLGTPVRETSGDRPAVIAWLTGVLRSGRPEMRREVATLSGRPDTEQLSFEVFATAVDADRVVLQIRDVTESVRLRAALERDALHDALTGLPNRRWFTRRLRRALNRLDTSPATVAVLFLDVDGFKLVNDSLGHVAGDQLLCQMALRVSAAVRPSDSVARFGGDELLVLCEDLDDTTAALTIAQRAHDAACGAYTIGGSTVRVTVSLGLATTHVPQPTDQLISEADAALYEAKRQGRDRVEVYDVRLGQQAAHALTVYDELIQAIDAEELELFYQPKYDLLSGRIVAAEALLRWRHPVLGLRQPADFLPVAESTGLMTRIGAWVLHEAFTEAASWPGDQECRVNVNLSTRELMHPDLLEVLEGALARTGLDPSRATVEITESHAVDDAPRLIAVLTRIRDLGLRIALDDFGTGYSSLIWLQRFPISLVKLDRSFIGGLTADATEHTILKSTIALAHALGMAVVGEGIETDEQRDLLMELGCDFGQGYALARPMPAAEFRLLLQNQPALKTSSQSSATQT